MAGVKGRSGGKNRVPTAIKLLRNTAQPCRTNPDEPAVAPGAPPKPADMEREVEAEWDRWLPLLVDELRVLTPADGRAFLQLCRSCARVDDAWKVLIEEGAIDHGENGSTRSAAAKEYDQANAEVMRWCGAFGVTPADRARVKATAPAKKEPSEREKRKERFFGGAS